MNTYIRVCVRCGNLRMARRAFERMRQWDVVPDDTTHKLMGRLLAQGLRCDELKKLIKSVRKGEHVRWTNDPNSGPCQFWRAGKCERGVNCRFYHDPSIAQSDALEKEIESNDTLASLYVNHAHASAVCGQFEQCAKSLDKAGECLTEDGGAGGLRDKDERAELFRRTNRDELKLEMQRVKAFAERVQKRKQEPPNLESHLSKTLIFSSQILEAPARESKMSSEEVDALRANLYAALKDTMGLVDSECSVKRAVRKCIADDGTMRFDRMFGRSKKDKREVNLEVAAGNGDWAVAQAKADDSRRIGFPRTASRSRVQYFLPCSVLWSVQFRRDGRRCGICDAPQRRSGVRVERVRKLSRTAASQRRLGRRQLPGAAQRRILSRYSRESQSQGWTHHFQR